MKKYLLLTLSLFLFSAFLYPQNLIKVPVAKEKRIEKIPFTLTNQLKITAASFSESFESATFPPTGWNVFTQGGSGWSRQTAGTPLPNWEGTNWETRTISTPPGGGNAVAYCTFGSSPTFNDQWLITPVIQNIQATDTLFFWLRNQVISFADSVYIYYSTDGTNFNQMGQVLYPAGSDTNWGKWFITIGTVIPAGSNVNIGFREFLFDNQQDGGAISLDLVAISGTTSTYPSTIQLSKTYSFGDPAKNTSYRLIGIPGNNNLPVNTFITGTQKKDWNVFYDDGSEPINLTEFNGQATFNFTPGKGFWALSRNSINVSRQVNTVTLAGNAFNIPLHSGWNIISNPFEKNVSLADIRNANTLPNAIIYSFSGNFTQPASMAPYEGYYFLNPDGRASLSIPYPFTSSLPKTTGQTYFLSDKSLKLKLSSDEFASEVMVGFEPTASNDYDEMDYFAPPGNFEELNIRLQNENLSTVYKQLFIEHRPGVGEGQSFDVQIKNETNKNVKLTIDRIEKFSEYKIYLLDERLKKFYDLKDQNEISISGNHHNNEFKLLIGNQEFINLYKSINTPTEFALYQNYPNPFNPETSIKYSIGKKQFVSLKVYDILGNLVTTLVNEEQPPGFYEVQFDGSKLSSGIYLYEFQSSNLRTMKKMTLIK